MIEYLIEIDKSILLAINGLHNNFFDFLMDLISKKSTWIPIYLFFIFILIKKYGREGIFITLLLILTVSVADLVSVHLFKNVFERLRPCHDPSLQGLLHLVDGNCGGKYGFVSSHSANMFALATIFYMFVRKYFKMSYIPLVAWAALIGYSRVYLGVHYPGDVLAGAVVGIIIGLIFYCSYFLIMKSKLGKKGIKTN